MKVQVKLFRGSCGPNEHCRDGLGAPILGDLPPAAIELSTSTTRSPLQVSGLFIPMARRALVTFHTQSGPLMSVAASAAALGAMSIV